MDAIPLIQRLHQHRIWATNNLLDAAEQLSTEKADTEKLHADFEIGQGSVWKSLAHMQAAEYLWLETLLGNETALFPGNLPGKLPGNQQGEGGIKDFADLRRKWSALDKRWAEYLAGLAPAALDETIYRTRRTGDHEQQLRLPPPRRFAARLHPRALHDRPGGQHAATLRRRKTAAGHADRDGDDGGRVNQRRRPATIKPIATMEST